VHHPLLPLLALAMLAHIGAAADIVSSQGGSAIPGQDDASSTMVINGASVRVPANSRMVSQDGSTLITTPNGRQILVQSDGTVITTGVNPDGSITRSVQTPPLSAPSQGGGVVSFGSNSSRWDPEPVCGVRFGGIIGASFDNSLSYDLRSKETPVLNADIGVSGMELGAGIRYSLGHTTYAVINDGMPMTYHSNSAVTLRLIAPYRWMDNKHAPSIWYGISSISGWHYGAEVDLLVENLAITAQATWAAQDHSPHVTLAYGFGF